MSSELKEAIFEGMLRELGTNTMGTNYYWRPVSLSIPKIKNIFMVNHENCPEWIDLNNHPELGIHLGKNSFGWVFVLQTYHDYGVTGLTDIVNLMLSDSASPEIFDEYGDRFTIGDFVDLVLRYQGPYARSHVDKYRSTYYQIFDYLDRAFS